MILSIFLCIILGGWAQVSWRPVFRQTVPGLFKPGEWSLNPDDPNADMFSVLDKLESMRNKKGGFTFKLRWSDPDLTETMHWKQTSNPYINRTKGVIGYEAVKITHTDYNWGGLEYNPNQTQSILDGSIGAGTWFYCIGYTGINWGYGLAMPSFARPAHAAELFAMDPKTSKWVLVFRQTLPYLWAGQWSLNKDDPYNENYAILDQLETFRNPSDGKLELKMNWPDRYNTWYQTSNPVTNTGAKVTVPGYEAIKIQFNQNNWGGLESNNLTSGESLLDGSIGNGLFFYAIGYEGYDWGSKLIPAYQIGANQAELFVQIDS